MADTQPDTGEQQNGPTGDGTGADTGPTGTGQGADTGPEQDQATELAKWKTLARQHEAKAKANADAAARLAQLEESQKTEQQKLAERADAAEKRAQAAELAVLRSQVAAGKGLPAGLASRLSGATQEELEADADQLLEQIKAAGTTPPPPGASGRPPAPPAGSQQAPQTPEDMFASLIRGG